jgi:hypothetical protein
VSGKFQHQDVIYSVQLLGERRWRWEVSPPKCVIVLNEEIGEVDMLTKAEARAVKVTDVSQLAVWILTR